jgi:monovalent cation:H+ antiporter-2, CPA2 family
MDLTNPVISIAILLAAALVGGMVAHRLKQPVILGYLVVGAVVGPHALRLVSDTGIVQAAATIGVALLMFTLGLEVSGSQLRQVGRVGLWGGALQIIITIGAGLLAGLVLCRWSLSQASLFGLVIAMSSTAVCLKILMDRGELDSMHGRIMIAILILQDISVALLMVVVPLMGGTLQSLPLALALAVGKGILAVGLAIVTGLWILPWLMGRVGGVRARELFLLMVLVLSLGAALATEIFGLSAVFGAFLIGFVLRESRYAYQALAEITPLRDIFSTLFFVSLGMLLDWGFMINHWAMVLATLVAIIVIKFLVVFGIVRLFGYSGRIAFIAGAGLFQIGEFAFILAQAGLNAGVIDDHFYSLMLSSAILTMLLTPVSISFASRLYPGIAAVVPFIKTPETSSKTGSSNQVVVAGYGRTGQNIAQGLQDAKIPFTIIDIDPERIADAQTSERPYIFGDASNPLVLSHIDLKKVRVLVVTYPDPIAVVSTVRTALQLNPDLKIVARVHRTREADLLKEMGVVEMVNPEYEASLQFLKRVLETSGVKEAEVEKILPLVEEKQDSSQFEHV